MIGANGAVLDGWTTLCVLAGATRRVRLCLIQGSTLFRHAPQFAKMVATLDQLSAGRLTVFGNPGRAEAEHRAYGFPWFDSFADRFARHRETLEVLLAMWTEMGPISRAGPHFPIQEAIAAPQPLQRPHPPLWFAGREPDLLDLTASIGAGWNTPPVSLDDFKRDYEALSGAVEAVGRPISELTVSLETQVLVRRTLPELRQVLRDLVSRPSGQTLRPALLDANDDAFLRGDTDVLPSALTDRFLIGTPDQVEMKIEQYARAGVNAFGCWFLDFPDFASAKLIMERRRI